MTVLRNLTAIIIYHGVIRIVVHLVLSINVLDHLDGPLWWDHIPQAVRSQYEAAMACNVDRHRIDIRFRRHDELVRCRVETP